MACQRRVLAVVVQAGGATHHADEQRISQESEVNREPRRASARWLDVRYARLEEEDRNGEDDGGEDCPDAAHPGEASGLKNGIDEPGKGETAEAVACGALLAHEAAHAE